jgi:hypothetical protein
MTNAKVSAGRSVMVARPDCGDPALAELEDRGVLGAEARGTTMPHRERAGEPTFIKCVPRYCWIASKIRDWIPVYVYKQRNPVYKMRTQTAAALCCSRPTITR